MQFGLKIAISYTSSAFLYVVRYSTIVCYSEKIWNHVDVFVF